MRGMEVLVVPGLGLLVVLFAALVLGSLSPDYWPSVMEQFRRGRCTWCRDDLRGATATVRATSGGRFCSEDCASQSDASAAW